VAPLFWYTPRRRNLLGWPLASFQHQQWRSGACDQASLQNLAHLSRAEDV